MATPLTRTKIDEKSIMERKKKRKETTSKKRSSRRLPQRRVLDSAAIVIRRLCGFANGKIRRKVHGFPPGYDGDYSRVLNVTRHLETIGACERAFVVLWLSSPLHFCYEKYIFLFRLSQFDVWKKKKNRKQKKGRASVPNRATQKFIESRNN